MLIDGEKYACEACVKGHRASSCKHVNREPVRVGRKGGTHKCPYCGEVFNRPARVREHLMSRHNVYDAGNTSIRSLGSQRFNSCEECHKSFIRKHDLQRHFIKAHTSRGHEKSACTSCGAVYADRRSMLRHQRQGCRTANSNDKNELSPQQHHKELGQRLFEAASAATLASSSPSSSSSGPASSSSHESKRGTKKRTGAGSSASAIVGACLPCRQRNVKCTKTLPCVACVEKRLEKHCSYEQPTTKRRIHPTPVPPAQVRAKDHAHVSVPTSTESTSASQEPDITSNGRQSLEQGVHAFPISPDEDGSSSDDSLDSFELDGRLYAVSMYSTLADFDDFLVAKMKYRSRRNGRNGMGKSSSPATPATSFKAFNEPSYDHLRRQPQLSPKGSHPSPLTRSPSTDILPEIAPSSAKSSKQRANHRHAPSQHLVPPASTRQHTAHLPESVPSRDSRQPQQQQQQQAQSAMPGVTQAQWDYIEGRWPSGQKYSQLQDCSDDDVHQMVFNRRQAEALDSLHFMDEWKRRKQFLGDRQAEPSNKPLALNKFK
jgi:hypothetical protein